MIRHKIIFLLMAVCAGFTIFGAVPAQALNQLKDIGVQKAGDSIVVIITTGQPCEFHPFLTTTKPERIVIDLTDVVNVWSEKKFMQIPAKSIQAIRTSQFVAKPVPVTRVVLDIGRPIDFRSFSNGNDVVIKIPMVEGETDFASWNVKDSAPPPKQVAEKPVAKPAETAAKPVAKPVKKQEAKAAQKEEAKPKRKASGVEIESYPKRKVVAYQTSQYRDPFEPLIGGSGGHLIGDLPVLENLALVGILSNEDGNRALLEDAEGNGYILMPKDRVKNGYLVSVSETKAIFQITEYGWTRTVALELDIEEIK
jgi:hypothetical protein